MLVVVQPRSFQVTATKRREVTASWEHQGQGKCVVMLNNHNGAMETCTEVIELKLYLFIYLFYIIVCLKVEIDLFHNGDLLFFYFNSNKTF